MHIRLPGFLFFFITLGMMQCRSGETNPASGPAADTAVVQQPAHPAWCYQSCIYEVNLRQYSAEGNFTAFAKSLRRIRDMGVGILWFMPIQPIGLEGRKWKTTDLGSYYAVKDYHTINPEFGNLQQWKDLVAQAQQMGFKVILDWVPNHSSPDNRWITAHPGFYKRDSAGQPLIPNNWTDTRKLNYDNRELRDSMIAEMSYWVRETGIDGFRCDVAGDVPDDFWKKAIDSLRTIKTLFMLAEGDKPSLHEDGFDATYPWSAMSIAYGIAPGKTTVKQLDSVIRYDDSIFPTNALRMYYTTNHDENSWNGTEFERFGDGYKTFAIWAFTMGKSLPLIYSGQEEPNKRRLPFFVKDSIRWGKYGLAGFYETLINLRLSTTALAGDARFIKLKSTLDDQGIFAYLREKDNHRVLVLLNFSKKPRQFSLMNESVNGRAKNVFSGELENIESKTVYHLKPWDWRLYEYDAK